MLRRLLRRVRAWTDRDEGTTFVGSVLDRSVRDAHGGGSEDAERELERTRREAARLERAQAERLRRE